MDGSGSISVKTEKHSETQARIEIKDSGIGISEEKLQKINALKDLSIDKIDRSKGIGLGLLLCQTLIKKNNGTLFFKSEEGTSTTAVILLPLA
jgi:signal transduction histidine kinase